MKSIKQLKYETDMRVLRFNRARAMKHAYVNLEGFL